jgi:hypothetical protein
VARGSVMPAQNADGNITSMAAIKPPAVVIT